jgi:hypothetical protein
MHVFVSQTILIGLGELGPAPAATHRPCPQLMER